MAAAEVVILASGPGPADRAPLRQMTGLVMSERRWDGACW